MLCLFPRDSSPVCLPSSWDKSHCSLLILTGQGKGTWGQALLGVWPELQVCRCSQEPAMGTQEHPLTWGQWPFSAWGLCYGPAGVWCCSSDPCSSSSATITQCFPNPNELNLHKPPGKQVKVVIFILQRENPQCREESVTSSALLAVTFQH